MSPSPCRIILVGGTHLWPAQPITTDFMVLVALPGYVFYLVARTVKLCPQHVHSEHCKQRIIRTAEPLNLCGYPAQVTFTDQGIMNFLSFSKNTKPFTFTECQKTYVLILRTQEYGLQVWPYCSEHLSYSVNILTVYPALLCTAVA